MEEEKNALVLAPPLRARPLVAKRCFAYALTHDLNKAIHILRLLTTDYSKEDETRFFVEPIDMLENLTLIYHRLLMEFDEDMEHNSRTEPRVILSQLS